MVEFTIFEEIPRMSHDPHTLDRLRHILQARKVAWEEKKMFGGICFMVHDKMCFGISDRGLLLRIDPEESVLLSKQPGLSLMVHGTREMVGYLRAEPVTYDRDADLEQWIDKCLAYNPLAQSSKKR